MPTANDFIRQAIEKLQVAKGADAAAKVGYLDAAVADLKEGQKAALKALRTHALAKRDVLPGQTALDDHIPKPGVEVTADAQGVVQTPADTAAPVPDDEPEVPFSDPFEEEEPPAETTVGAIEAAESEKQKAESAKARAEREAREQGKRAVAENIILAQLQEAAPEPLTNKQVIERSGLDTGTVNNVLSKLAHKHPHVDNPKRGHYRWIGQATEDAGTVPEEAAPASRPKPPPVAVTTATERQDEGGEPEGQEIACEHDWFAYNADLVQCASCSVFGHPQPDGSVVEVDGNDPTAIEPNYAPAEREEPEEEDEGRDDTAKQDAAEGCDHDFEPVDFPEGHPQQGEGAYIRCSNCGERRTWGGLPYEGEIYDGARDAADELADRALRVGG